MPQHPFSLPSPFDFFSPFGSTEVLVPEGVITADSNAVTADASNVTADGGS